MNRWRVDSIALHESTHLTGKYGQYSLLERLAVGGTAEVFRASEPRQVGEARMVVVKRLRSSLAHSTTATELLRREAKTTALVTHPNVVRVVDEGEHDGLPFLVIEYVPGLDLYRFQRWLMRRRLRLEPRLALHIATELLQAVDAVHSAKKADGTPAELLHRDISPSNVIVSLHGEVKLTDFGIALTRDDRRGPLQTQTRGKLGYVAPELVDGAVGDERSDIFSVGVMLAELLLGHQLFVGDSELSILLAIREGRIDAFRSRSHEFPSGIVRATLESIAVDPHLRIRSAKEFLYMLSPQQGVTESVSTTELLRSSLALRVMEAVQDRGNARSLATSTSRTVSSMQSVEETPILGTPTIRPSIDVVERGYRIKKQSGQELGPFRYVDLVRAIAAKQCDEVDLISIDGGPYRPLGKISELLKPAPAVAESLSNSLVGNSNIAEGAVVSVLADAVIHELSGTLVCDHGTVRKEVYVERGVPEFVRSNVESELLGEYLVAHGVLARSELDLALAVMPRFDGRIGDTLIALGLIDSISMFRHIAAQVRERVLELFVWTEGTVRFDSGTQKPERSFPLGIQAWQLLYEGVEERLRRGLLPELIAPPTLPRLVANAALSPKLDRASLRDSSRALLKRVATPTALESLLGSNNDELLRVDLALLFAASAIRWTT